MNSTLYCALALAAMVLAVLPCVAGGARMEKGFKTGSLGQVFAGALLLAVSLCLATWTVSAHYYLGFGPF